MTDEVSSLLVNRVQQLKSQTESKSELIHQAARNTTPNDANVAACSMQIPLLTCSPDQLLKVINNMAVLYLQLVYAAPKWPKTLLQVYY